MSVSGAIFAGWLSDLELAVIDAVCRWCIASAVVTLGLLASEGIGVARLLAVPVSGDAAAAGPIGHDWSERGHQALPPGVDGGA